MYPHAHTSPFHHSIHNSFQSLLHSPLHAFPSICISFPPTPYLHYHVHNCTLHMHINSLDLHKYNSLFILIIRLQTRHYFTSFNTRHLSVPSCCTLLLLFIYRYTSILPLRHRHQPILPTTTSIPFFIICYFILSSFLALPSPYTQTHTSTPFTALYSSYLTSILLSFILLSKSSSQPISSKSLLRIIYILTHPYPYSFPL